jgi:GntR family transcriptional regulator/MocR family aminotransferase
MDYALLVSTYAKLNKAKQWSGQRLLHECLRAAIRNGTLAAGTRMPSSRVLATELGIARNTALYAYEQLATEGYVFSERRGTTVATLAAATAARSAANGPRRSLSQRAQAVKAEQFSPVPSGFAPGVPALDEFPVTVWRRLLDRSWRSLPTALLNYGDPLGEPALREAIANHLRATRGADCGFEQVIITDGTQGSLDLCARALADAGDKAWIENPGYAGALAAFRGAQLKVVGIAQDDDGIAPQDSDWERHRPRLIYTTPSHQYPTGAVMNLERRLALMDGARRCGALIIEDDYDSEFRHDGPPLSCMQGLAPDAPVIYLGTFSKTMFPALRIGFMVVPTSLMPNLQPLLAKANPRGRSADQLALAEYLQSGQFALHLRRMRRLYKQRRDALVEALERHLGHVGKVLGGSAGMHLVLRFDDRRLDDKAMSERAAARGVVAYSLSSHAIGREHGWRGFVLGYAQVPSEQMERLVRLLAKSVYE